MRRRTVTARFAATLLAGSSCSPAAATTTGPTTPPAAAPTRRTSRPPPTLKATWPLTGLPVTGDDEAAQKHPVMVLKMDNTYASAPQEGLGSADMVVEELVEGGMTRLAAFYYSQIPGDVGPVRSMRASDIGIVSPVNATVVTSGAAAGDDQPDRRRRHPLVHRGRQGLLPRLEPARSLQPVHRPVRDRDAGRPGGRRAARRLPAVGRREGLPAGPAGAHPRRVVLGRAHHELDVQGRHLRQREHLRRRRRRVPGRHRAGAAGQGRRRGLPRPGRQPGAGDAVHRPGPGADLPRRPPGARAVDQGRRWAHRCSWPPRPAS